MVFHGRKGTEEPLPSSSRKRFSGKDQRKVVELYISQFPMIGGVRETEGLKEVTNRRERLSRPKASADFSQGELTKKFEPSLEVILVVYLSRKQRMIGLAAVKGREDEARRFRGSRDHGIDIQRSSIIS